MKFSVNWLREFIELPASVDELAELLTLAGIEIEGIEKRGASFDHVIVAQINESSQHPNADRLSVCQVNDGSGTARQIVCGAKNYKAGDKVPLALPGAVLMNDLKIKASKLRGVESNGMLCSPSELGLSQDGDGLLILSPDATIGAPLATLFPEDTILDVEITPNRGDLLSHLGLAREIAALSGKTLRSTAASPSTPTRPKAGVRISAPTDCPFYSARRIEGVKVGPTPNWLRVRLEAAGLRSINNIVDITNFVMLELGQPLHAFDADKLTGEINVRHAQQDEKFLALDGRTYSLEPANLVIADDVRAVGIGGVMGGEDTGVTSTTTNVLLESAYFRPGSVRRTARELSLPSDSSYRFERGVDPGMILAASERATALIKEIASGTPANEVAIDGELPPLPANVSLRYQRCDRLIGVDVPPERVDQILAGFGLKKISNATPEKSEWKIPSYRPDLQREADLIEEVVRVFGIEQVPVSDRSRFTPESEADRSYDIAAVIRRRLVAKGLSEARTSALIPRQTRLPDITGLLLRNPLSEDHVALRPTLLLGLLDVLERNVRAGISSIRLFELGHVFASDNAAQTRHVTIVLSGTTISKPHWRSTSRLLDLFDLKGIIEAIGIPNLSFNRSKHPNLSFSADVSSAGNTIGFLGQISAATTEALGASAPVLVAEIEIDQSVLGKRHALFQEIEKFPSVTRDIAMIVPTNLSHAEIQGTIEALREPLLASVELFDLFSGKEAENLGAGKKSLAYTLTYRDKKRTLTNDEVSVIHTKVREQLKSELRVELRE